MMKIKNKFFIVTIMIFIILGMHITSAIAVIEPVADNSFFYTNKQEIEAGATLEMTLDISKIEYDEFEFKLTSNLDTNNIVINEDIETENYNNEISINIDKSKINLDKITFYYQVPENSQIGTNMELLATIITQTEEAESEVVESKKIDVKIVEKKQTNNQEKPNEQINQDNIPNEQDKTNSFEKNEMANIQKPSNNTQKLSEEFQIGISAKSNNAQNTNFSVNSINASNMQTQIETAVYNGSSNNYLERLEVEGESLSTTFNKENTTYFVKTNSKTELNVIATAEDTNAKVYVTGNENLKTGDNKILISVTAENGDVRYYRIFVTNN